MRYKRKMENNSDTNENQMEDNGVPTQKTIDKKIKSKRVRLDPNSVVINLDSDQDFDKRSLSES